MNFTSDNAVGRGAADSSTRLRANDGRCRPMAPIRADAGRGAHRGDFRDRLPRVFRHHGHGGECAGARQPVPPWGTVFCHRNAHIEVDECGAPEFYGGGLKLALLDGADGKIPCRADDALREIRGGRRASGAACGAAA